VEFNGIIFHRGNEPSVFIETLQDSFRVSVRSCVMLMEEQCSKIRTCDVWSAAS